MSMGEVVTVVSLGTPLVAMFVYLLARLIFAAYFLTARQFKEKQDGR